MKRRLAVLLLLAGCSPDADTGNAAGAALEQAAIAAGVVRDPRGGALAGLYMRDTDQLCIFAKEGGYRIGVSVDYGDQGCSATGSVTREAGRLAVSLDGAPGCRFDARLDGDRIVFPAELPDACATLCTGRASLAAVEVDLLSQATTEVTALRDRSGRELCR